MKIIEPTVVGVERPFLTKKLLAQRYGVCERTIQNWSNAGLLVFLKRRRVVRYHVAGCDSSLIQQGVWSSAISSVNPQPHMPTPGNL